MSELIARRQDLPLRRPALRGTSETLDLSAAMQSADEFAFTYDPAEDRFRFDTPAMVLLGVPTISDVETGVGFQMRVGAEFREARRRIITPPPTGMQHSYCVQYRFEPGGKLGAVMAALKALERARGRRVDGFVAFEPRPEEDNVKRLNATLASALINALDENRMSLLLQPLVTASTGLPDHYECLLRMVRSDGTLISAGEFMPIAEQLGIARLLDLRAQELAVDLLKRYPSAKLSLNVSGLTASDNEWIVSLHRLTQGKRQYLQRLTVEITETAAIHDLDQSMIFVDTIKDLGCKVAIDDFGVGYTNFRNLKALNADLVKIDGAFVRNVCHDRGDQVFVRSMVELAKAFGMQTVAEWVGDAETASFLTGAGIDFLQGYHFGEPAPPETVLGAPTPA